MRKQKFREFAEVNLSPQRVELAVRLDNQGLIEIPPDEKSQDMWKHWADENIGTAFNPREERVYYESASGEGLFRKFSDPKLARRFCLKTKKCNIVSGYVPIPEDMVPDDWDGRFDEFD